MKINILMMTHASQLKMYYMCIRFNRLSQIPLNFILNQKNQLMKI